MILNIYINLNMETKNNIADNLNDAFKNLVDNLVDISL